MLANLFLHYAFDRWMRLKHAGTPFERYADDIVCHCDTMKQAVRLKAELERRFGEVGLTLHPEKSHIVYVDTFKRHDVKTSFTFLGYDFKLRVVKSRKTGKLRRVCMPGASSKAMKEIVRTIRSWRNRRRSQEAGRSIQRHLAWLDRVLRQELVPELRIQAVERVPVLPDQVGEVEVPAFYPPGRNIGCT